MSTILPEEEIDRLTKPITQRAAQTRRLEKLLGCKLAHRRGLRLESWEILPCFELILHAASGISLPIFPGAHRHYSDISERSPKAAFTRICHP